MTPSLVRVSIKKKQLTIDCYLPSTVCVCGEGEIKKFTRQIVKAELNIDQTWSGLTPTTS